MQILHIVPNNFFALTRLHTAQRWMILGQELLRDDLYRERCRRLSMFGAKLTVDNGAAERDQPPFEDIVKVANYVGADEIVMPDVLADMHATLVNITDKRYLRLVPPQQRVVIPQGKNSSEWSVCCEILCRDVNFAILGIPKHTERFDAGRTELIRFSVNVTRQPIHLFGVYQNPMNEIVINRNARVRSLDTGAAVAYAQANKMMSCGKHVGLEWNAEPSPGAHKRALVNMHILEAYGNSESTFSRLRKLSA